MRLNIGRKGSKEVVGSIRQSQAITTFGVGAMVDFVNQTAMISGLDKWNWSGDSRYQIHNQNLENLLRVDFFVTPKWSVKERMWDEPSADLPATVFPKWLYNPVCKKLVKASRNIYKKGKFVCYCETCKGRNRFLPSRFVLVCPKGHIEDFPYSWWVHRGEKCTQEKPVLRMYYAGDRTDMDSLIVECSCGLKRSLKGASAKDAFAGYRCSGNRPWLGDHEECDAFERGESMQFRIRNESSVYFPITVSALTIPPWSSKIAKELQKHLTCYTPDESGKEGLAKLVASKFQGVEPNVVLDMINSMLVDRKTNRGIRMQDIMQDEYKAIVTPAVTDDSDDFISHEEEVPEGFDHIIERVIAVERLTVVTAMIGFTRLKSASGISDPHICKISQQPKNWYPGIEQRGEGIFIQFNQTLLDKWTSKNGRRYADMERNLKASDFAKDFDRFSPQYVFLHTFAHLFIRELSMQCGYSAASLRERIYSTYQNSERKMAGILIYTSTSDADGSLGGLTEQAKTIRFEKIVQSMIERGKWCSSDPVCYLSKEQGFMSLNYAACFACTLLPETSCEFYNALLDRCSVCGSPEDERIGVMNWKKHS